MLVKTISAPHLNVNDLEMNLACWHVSPWQKVAKGDIICEVESTKAAVSIEVDNDGYVYPVVGKGTTVKVGEPLAHIFSSADITELDLLKNLQAENEGAIVTKKARAMMDEFGLTVSDFPKFSNISSDTVIAKLREREGSYSQPEYNENSVQKLIDKLILDEKSVVIYGERNQALLAMDVFLSGNNFSPVAYVSPENACAFYDLPVLPQQALGLLRAKGFKKVYISEHNVESLIAYTQECERLGFEIMSIVHPSAAVSSSASLEKGVFVGAMAVIGPDVRIGEFSRILSGASVAHHSKIGRYVTISDGAHLGGNVVVGDKTLIGIGANVNKRIQIGSCAVIVSGATVVDHVPDGGVVRLGSGESACSQGSPNAET